MLPGLLGYGLIGTPQAAGVGLPCLWRLWLGFPCPGCGLSRANALLIAGSVREAVVMNWLIVPVWAVAIWSFVAAILKISQEATSWQN